MNSKENLNNSDGEASRSSSSDDSSSQERIEFITNRTKNFDIRNNTNTTNINNKESSTSQSSSSPSSSSSASSVINAENDETKRAAARKLIEQYFYQLSEGCGQPFCNNKYCASSGEVEKLTPNQAAARAIQLYSQDAQLCIVHPSKRSKIQYDDDDDDDDDNNTLATTGLIKNKEDDDNTKTSSRPNQAGASTDLTTNPINRSFSTSGSVSTSNNNYNIGNIQSSASSGSIINNQVKDDNLDAYIDENKLNDLIEYCQEKDIFSPLIRCLGRYFSSKELMANSFQKKSITHIDAILEKAPKDLKTLKKEDFRTLEGDLDKDEDSCADKKPLNLPKHFTSVDLISLRRSIKKLQATKSGILEPLNNALHTLGTDLSIELRFTFKKDRIEEIITVFVIVFEIIMIGSNEFFDVALPSICKAATHLPIWAQARLAWIWSEHCKNELKNLIQVLQQLISIQVITKNYHDDFIVQENETVACATKILKIVYYANILAADKLESSKLRQDDDDDDNDIDDSSSSPTSEGERGIGRSVAAASSIFNDFESPGYRFSKPKFPIEEDLLAIELNVNILDCPHPFLPYEEFYNEPLSDAIRMDNDYLIYKNRRADTKKFTFMLHSFILTPATKTLALYFDSRVRMYSERRQNMLHTQFHGQPANPYLKLHVRRAQIIEDALVELELIALGNPKDLKKQLVVEFIDEQGIDEGGVSKEFFQLIVENIFNPDYGMFIYKEDTNCVWFNANSFETEAQFTLIGIVLGLAIYNNIILAVKFPMVVYKKLMGIKGSFIDLKDWDPILYNNMNELLKYEDTDIEDVFLQTFKITYHDISGSTLTHELKRNGDNILVNQDNKQEFVDLYANYLLNKSINKQFKAFQRGFQMVTDESPLHLLFRPEEIELIVCGSLEFDFNQLEKSTEYDGGFTEKSQTIIDFWDIVHNLSIESKKKLLEFTTGSDRVPVGGLSRLKLIISRNGPDCDRLPTSHTCYNILLLPEYSSKEKLEDRLLKAINYSKGFGML